MCVNDTEYTAFSGQVINDGPGERADRYPEG